MDLRQVEVEGMRHAYREMGEGPPLVFLHGVLPDSRFWEPQLHDLSDSFRVIAWDAPGVGGSEDPEQSIGIDGYAGALAAFLEVIDAVPATIVGLSWGGILTLEFYRRHSDQVRSLVLADTYAGWKGSLSATEYEARRDAALAQLERGGIPDEIPGAVHPDARAEAHRIIADMPAEARPAGFEAMARAMLDGDSSDVLGRVSVPTLLIWGGADERSTLDVAHAFKTAIPDSQLAVIPGAGHVSSLEHPAAFNRAIRDFLA
jgi:pimeloyl-ACP methyl ester carboxylesterase